MNEFELLVEFHPPARRSIRNLPVNSGELRLAEYLRRRVCIRVFGLSFTFSFQL